MKKFEKALMGGDSSLKDRASLLCAQAELASKSIVDKLKKEIIEVELAIKNLNDLGPETKDSLRPSARNWNASEWATKQNNLSFELYKLKIKLKIAQSNYDTFFGEVEEEEVAKEAEA